MTEKSQIQEAKFYRDLKVQEIAYVEVGGIDVEFFLLLFVSTQMLTASSKPRYS